jgi:hypothetical protein
MRHPGPISGNSIFCAELQKEISHLINLPGHAAKAPGEEFYLCASGIEARFFLCGCSIYALVVPNSGILLELS